MTLRLGIIYVGGIRGRLSVITELARHKVTRHLQISTIERASCDIETAGSNVPCLLSDRALSLEPFSARKFTMKLLSAYLASRKNTTCSIGDELDSL